MNLGGKDKKGGIKKLASSVGRLHLFFFFVFN